MTYVGAQNWTSEAACRDHAEPELWWPEGVLDHPVNAHRVQAAKLICSMCPVREDCLAYALSHKPNQGIWGGLTAQERAALHKDRNPTLL